MSLIYRSYPGDMSAGTGLTFRAGLNADRAKVYGGINALEAMIELLGESLFNTGTLPQNTAALTINSPVAGRVYCPAGYKAMIGGVPIITTATLSQAYTASAMNHVFLVVGTDGTLSLRCGATTTAASNECWIGDVTSVPAVDMNPVGKPKILIVLGLSSSAAVNLKTVGTTNLYTVPTGKNAIITDVIIRCTDAASFTVAPAVGVGVAAGEDDIMSSMTLVGFTALNKVFRYSCEGTYVSVAAGSVIKLGVDTGATATTATAEVILRGFLL